MTLAAIATEFEAVIGLETHVQLHTASKMFSHSSAAYQRQEPNTVVDPVSMALPGTLPVVNKRAVEYAIKIGLALNCQVADITKFDRKQYMYPDLMKGYQISQYDEPICYDGYIDLPSNPPHRVRINRVHMEEDVARLVHIESPTGGAMHSLLDINRAGVPLMEVVTEPDLRTAEHVELYITGLQSIIQYLGVGSASMEEGSFRCDANISVRPFGTDQLGEKVEVKNMNRVRAVREAVEFETRRQIAAITSGERVVQETRGWMDGEKRTVSQRSKEDAHDYRYFPEPDIPPIHIDEEWLSDIRGDMPELPQSRKRRFVTDYGLSEYDADLLVASRPTSEYFEEVLESANTAQTTDLAAFAKEASNWINGEVARHMSANDINDIDDVGIPAGSLAKLVRRFQSREINNTSAKIVFQEMIDSGADPDDVIAERGLASVGDTDSLKPIVAEVIASNPPAVQDYRSGKETAIRFLMGQVMKATRGTADPKTVMSMLKDSLSD